MKKQILRHIQTVNDMQKAHIPYTFVEQFGEEECAQISRKIIEQEISGIIQKLPEDMYNYFMKDRGLIGYLKQMEAVLDDHILGRLEVLIYQAGEEKLTDSECLDVQEVLLDEEIPSIVQYPFLKYFKSRNLGQKERHQVFKSLEKWREYGFTGIEKLSDEERMILAHPLFTTELLDLVWNTRETWTLLLREGVLPLLEMIYAASEEEQKINDMQLLQIAENPSQIQRLLQDILPFFEEEQRQRFLALWLDNGALLKDLKCMEKRLPGMEEEQKQRILESMLAYVCCVYKIRLEHIPAGGLDSRREQLLVYAVTAGKKHFLKLADENSETFFRINWDSMLLNLGIYRKHLNLNALNERNLKESCRLNLNISNKGKRYLSRGVYTFEELKVLAPLDAYYYRFYDLLTNERSDERLRILREFVKCDCMLFESMEEEAPLQRMALKLSEKPLSVWKRKELGHIKGLDTETVLRLLADWMDYQRFIPELVNGWQAMYLVNNKEVLSNYKTLEEFQNDILLKDKVWLYLKEKLSIEEAFIKKYEERIQQFVCQGEACIIYQLCERMEEKQETIRRLVTAELMGEFEKLKYYEGDLEKEIAFPIMEWQETAWKENMEKQGKGYRLWEEDRFIPVLQIGEIPIHTCMSYRDGGNKNCLLSCFDANKKVIYFERNGKTVFRALIRLSKGSVRPKPTNFKRVEFVDLTKERKKTESEEELILFLEKPYFGGISEEQEEQIVSRVFQAVREKAETLQARVIISGGYRKYKASEKYELSDYYMYISASKNGQQYLDSLGGRATVSDSGTYGKNKFLLENQEELVA